MLAISSLSFRLLVSIAAAAGGGHVFVTFGPYPLSVLPRAVSPIC